MFHVLSLSITNFRRHPPAHVSISLLSCAIIEHLGPTFLIPWENQRLMSGLDVIVFNHNRLMQVLFTRFFLLSCFVDFFCVHTLSPFTSRESKPTVLDRMMLYNWIRYFIYWKRLFIFYVIKIKVFFKNNFLYFKKLLTKF